MSDATTTTSLGSWSSDLVRSWDRFWFSPSQPHTLAAIRILAGSMLFYTHLIWAWDLSAFLGPDAWISRSLSVELAQDTYAWSFFWLTDSLPVLWALQVVALVVFAMLAMGCYTRVVSVLAWLIAISYCHRLGPALFGLDQVNTMLAMYLMIGGSGDVWSVDQWRRAKGQGTAPPSVEKVSTNIAVRLIQLHLCVIYLFGGIGKLRGELWWDGSASWFAAANFEYQSLDMTWLASWPVIAALLSHVTVFWETFYCVLIWPRLTRPVFLGLAVLVHAGIAIALGMITFGLAMIIANLAFIPPAMMRRLCSRLPGVRATGF